MADETKKAAEAKPGDGAKEAPASVKEAPPAGEAGAAAATDDAGTPKAEKKIKGKKRVDVEGRVFIRASFNNTIVTIADKNGNVVCWGTPGKGGFKGSRKSTPFAAGIAAEQAARTALSMGMRRVEIQVRGAGAGREAAIRSIQAAGLEVSSIKDVTGIPHNGCRAPKRRRV